MQESIFRIDIIDEEGRLTTIRPKNREHAVKIYKKYRHVEGISVETWKTSRLETLSTPQE